MEVSAFDLLVAQRRAIRECCPQCNGLGEVELRRPCLPTEDTGGMSEESKWIECRTCDGFGTIPRLTALVTPTA
jgi:hypothetical protein